MEKLSTHIAEEQLLFQLHMEPPLLKFTDYYLTIISYQNNQGRLFVDLKWSIWPRNDFFLPRALNFHDVVKLSFVPLW